MTKKSTQFFYTEIGDSPMGTVLVDELAELRPRGFALAFVRHAKSVAFYLSAESSNCISEFSCSLSPCSSLLKFVTNLLKP